MLFCGNPYTPQQHKESLPLETIKHEVNGIIIESKVLRLDDTFYEIMEGKYKGNLVHIWNVFN